RCRTVHAKELARSFSLFRETRDAKGFGGSVPPGLFRGRAASHGLRLRSPAKLLYGDCKAPYLGWARPGKGRQRRAEGAGRVSKKKKVRVELRKNRSKPPRPNNWTRGFQEHGFEGT